MAIFRYALKAGASLALLGVAAAAVCVDQAELQSERSPAGFLVNTGVTNPSYPFGLRFPESSVCKQGDQVQVIVASPDGSIRGSQILDYTTGTYQVSVTLPGYETRTGDEIYIGLASADADPYAVDLTTFERWPVLAIAQPGDCAKFFDFGPSYWSDPGPVARWLYDSSPYCAGLFVSTSVYDPDGNFMGTCDGETSIDALNNLPSPRVVCDTSYFTTVGTYEWRPTFSAPTDQGLGMAYEPASGKASPIFVQLAPVFPNNEECAASLRFPELSPDGAEGVLSLVSTDTSMFLPRVLFDNTGLCASSMYIDYTLSNNAGGGFFQCDRFVPDPSLNGETRINCNIRINQLTNIGVWTLAHSNVMIAKRDGPLFPTAIPRFRVVYSDLPQATGDLRRRQREVQAGLHVPSSVQCLRKGYQVCPIAGRLGSWECIDTSTKLDACGGCPQQGGQDCTELLGISTVACEAGHCKVRECDDRHRLTADNSACVPL